MSSSPVEAVPPHAAPPEPAACDAGGASSPLSRWHNRLVALPVFLAGSTVLGLAAWMTPSDEGLGTHRQLGLPPCGFEQVTGVPCATCGCTTSFSHAADGSLVQAFLTQPFGALLAVMTAMAVLISGYALMTDMRILPLIRFMTRGKVIGVMVGYMMVAWAYCIVKHVG